MEAFLKGLCSNKKKAPVCDAKVQSAFVDLAVALRDALPILKSSHASRESFNEASSPLQDYPASSTSLINASWLLKHCSTVSSALGANYLAECIFDVATNESLDEASQQAALFDVLGSSDQAMAVLLEIMPVMREIARNMRRDELVSGDAAVQNGNIIASDSVYLDLEEEKRQFLLQEAREAAQLAELARQELENANLYSNSSETLTHSVVRQSNRDAVKQVERLEKKAAQALARAKEQGAILDDEIFWKLDLQERGPGGLMKKSTNDLEALQDSLLASGAKQYYNDKGLPFGTIFEKGSGYEKVIIPAARRDESKLPDRLKIREVMDEACQRAFDGTETLNPMQSTVFDVAFWGRENMLVCAPTGAGKTNVAMLTVVSHFRDVGLLPGASASNQTIMETGRKVVYIAPMKALAQEVVEKFSSKLKSLRLIVRELTGDMQLTRAEAESANVIVTTPEKWDVVTRKSGTDELSLGNQCGLLIIDEVHLLADDRGAVIESVVARHHRLVEARQRQLRIVALSATLPNYMDVANFLQVPPRGIFFFGPEFRPVPLQQSMIGISTKDRRQRDLKMNEICYDIVIDSLRRGYQVMVFVHSRKGTGDTARALADLAAADGALESHFVTAGKDGVAGDAYSRYKDKVIKSRDRQVAIHFQNGMGIHHAGMLRGDRKLTENMFSDGAIKVLCCTA
ncbi:hypothetical protein MPSEU_000280400 [Mayamaea pseudoterrestris]|nr:hypothetical protein MPSEU_000280400 [Mayamaea pseudoterrestris]